MSAQTTITEDLVDYPAPSEDRSDRLAPETIEAHSVQTQVLIRCDWWEDAEKQLQAIAGLPVGWDSYGAPRPDPHILHSAACLLAPLCQLEGLVKPHINPTPSGGVQFEWETGPRYFEIEVVAERAATWFFRDDAAGEEEEGEVFETESLEIVVEFLRRAGAVQ